MTPAASRRVLSVPRLLWGVGLLLIGVGLAVLYFRQSRIALFNSDGGAMVLQAWTMSHGNPLLRGWWIADVSFYTTELPEYMLVEVFRGVRPEVVHICGGVTYALTVLLAALAARGGNKGRAGIVRALVAGGIMLAPGIFGGTQVFLENPDHAGTAVPVLLLLLLLDRAPERWYVPAAACVLLAWIQVADKLVLAVATVPIAAVALVRLGLLAKRRRSRADLGYEALLAVAAVASVPLGAAAELVMRSLGGYQMRALPPLLASGSRILANVDVLGQTILTLFGANGQGTGYGYLEPITLFHMIGLVMAIAAFAVGAVTFFSGRQDRVTQIVVVGAAALLVAGIFTTELPSLANAHEFAILLPFGAVLAGRVLPPLLPAGWDRAGWRPGRVLLPVLGLWLACSLTALCYAGTLAPPTPTNEALANWLVSHGLREGLAGYWEAASTTVDSGGKVLVAPVNLNGRTVQEWESSAAWYNPGTHWANFIVASTATTRPRVALSVSVERRIFGTPAREYHVAGWVVMVYRYNLLPKLNGRSFPSATG
jgi:hypothetical protein